MWGIRLELKELSTIQGKDSNPIRIRGCHRNHNVPTGDQELGYPSAFQVLGWTDSFLFFCFSCYFNAS